MDPKVYRNDLSEKDEKIPSWLRDFFVQSSITDDIVNSIKNKKQSIENVLKEYRSAIGLDAVEADVEDTIKTASVESSDKKVSKEAVMRPLSIRQAKVNVMDMIKKHPDIQNALISLLEHSGGTKSIYAILRFLRDKLGKEYVSYTDQDLMDYIETLKKQFRSVHTDNADANVGRVGMDTDFTDDVADYATQKPSK